MWDIIVRPGNYPAVHLGWIPLNGFSQTYFWRRASSCHWSYPFSHLSYHSSHWSSPTLPLARVIHTIGQEELRHPSQLPASEIFRLMDAIPQSFMFPSGDVFEFISLPEAEFKKNIYWSLFESAQCSIPSSRISNWSMFTHPSLWPPIALHTARFLRTNKVEPLHSGEQGSSRGCGNTPPLFFGRLGRRRSPHPRDVSRTIKRAARPALPNGR